MGVALYVRGASKIATAGLLCFGLSYAFSTAYFTVPYFEAVYLWQGGLFAVLAMYAAVDWFTTAETPKTFRVPWTAILGVLALSAYLNSWITRYDMEFVVAALIVATILTIYFKIDRKDIFARMVWVIVGIAETWAAVEIPACRFFADINTTTVADTWGVTTAKSTCAMAFDSEISIYIQPLIGAAFLLWIGLRWNQTRKV